MKSSGASPSSGRPARSKSKVKGDPVRSEDCLPQEVRHEPDRARRVARSPIPSFATRTPCRSGSFVRLARLSRSKQVRCAGDSTWSRSLTLSSPRLSTRRRETDTSSAAFASLTLGLLGSQPGEPKSVPCSKNETGRCGLLVTTVSSLRAGPSKTEGGVRLWWERKAARPVRGGGGGRRGLAAKARPSGASDP
jgi:hypothetical protein